MNVYQLEYFIMLAETLNYTKASEKLHITQPNLTKAILNIEKSIDCKLFERNKRDVKLTNAGIVFYDEIKKTLDCYNNAIKKAKDMDNGSIGTLSIGFLGTALMDRLPKIINYFYEEYPFITVQLTDYTYTPLLNAFNENIMDMAILPSYELSKIPYIKKKIIFCDDMCVVMNKDHKFAKLDIISIEDIKNESFIHMSAKKSLRDFNLINDICLEHNFLPNTVYEANTLINMLMMVECKIGVTILASHMKHFANENVVFVRLAEYINYFEVVCAWKDDTNPSISKFLEIVDKVSNVEY